AHYDDATSMIKFTLELKHDAPAAPVDLNAAAAAATGGSGTHYTETEITDNSQTWTTDQWKDHHIVAGTSGGPVHQHTAHKITPTDKWSPTTPTDGSPYAISQGAGDIGNVQLGDSLKTGSGDNAKGIGKANAVNATAKVTPSYDAHITLALNLQ